MKTLKVVEIILSILVGMTIAAFLEYGMETEIILSIVLLVVNFIVLKIAKFQIKGEER